MPANLVVVEYEDVTCPEANLSEAVYKAFGPNGIGAIGIRGVPNWEKLWRSVLPLSHTLATLPQEKLKALEHEPSMYNVGWSHGKEKLGDKPDFAKGSFYFNPLTDDPSPELREAFPWAVPENVWPSETDVPGMREKCRALGAIMYEMAKALSRHVDLLASSRVENYAPDTLYKEMSKTQKAKGRLLYYYPTESKAEDAWIGWHNDSGFLTCLTPDIYVKHDTGELVANPDPLNAGLWVADRNSVSSKVTIPDDIMVIQCGECLQIITGGLLVATPHCVRGAADPNIARISCPCFVDTSPTSSSACPRRWTKNGVNFAEFLGDTFKSYYEWNIKQSRLLLLPVESRQAAGQEENSGLLPIVSRTSQEYLKLAIESHEGSGGSTIAGSEADEDEEEEAMIASLCYDAPGEKTARGASKFLLGLPQNFMAASTEDSDVESPGGERPKDCAVRLWISGLGDGEERLFGRAVQADGESPAEYDGEEEVESDDGFDEAMFLNDADDDDSCSEKERRKRRHRSRRRMASDGDVIAALLSPIRRSTPCDPSSPCLTLTCGVDKSAPSGRRHSVGEVIRGCNGDRKRNPFLMATLEPSGSTCWRRHHIACAVHS
ncbi:hypothetical protein FOZ60_016133 [Perkinsus olseni]|uniref:Fe2OG dioxygenase domain-containing protein n=1 Tax=Perkinsus olseni TaxID=32597 RepID=A0A7J6P4X5_PEROL|nr:hypothetical protein FOZ60_016133 [Perkinsus olseni]